jgi:hypothetical protein
VSLQYDQPGTITAFRMSLPVDLGPPGGSVIATPRLRSGSKHTGTLFMVGGFGLAVAGFIAFGILDSRGGNSDEVAAGIGGGAVGIGLALAGTGIYLRAISHSPDIVVRASATSRPTFAVGPGFVEAGMASPAGLHLVATPMGVSGTF